MSGLVRTLVHDGTGLRPLSVLLVLCCGLGTASAGCAIDDREVGAGGAAGSEPGSEPASNPGTAPRVGSDSSANQSAGNGGPSGPVDVSAGNGSQAPGNGDAEFGGSSIPGSGSTPSSACASGTQRCEAGALQTCNAAGMWAPLGTTCGACVPDTTECLGSTMRVCSSTGAWMDILQCTGSQPLCNAATRKCICDESSCPLGQICSSETLTCVQQVSDCPVPSPIAVSENHDLGVVSVRFDAATGSADVRLQNINTGILFFNTALCNGADNCVLVRDGNTLQLNPRDTVDVTIPNTRVEGGELAFLDDAPELAVMSLAYAAWGTGPASTRFEELANAFEMNNWRPGERIQIAPGDTGFVSTGNANEAAGYTSCNPARFTP